MSLISKVLAIVIVQVGSTHFHHFYNKRFDHQASPIRLVICHQTSTGLAGFFYYIGVCFPFEICLSDTHELDQLFILQQQLLGVLEGVLFYNFIVFTRQKLHLSATGLITLLFSLLRSIRCCIKHLIKVYTKCEVFD